MSQWFIDNAESYRAQAKRDRDRGGNGVRLFKTTDEMLRGYDGADIETEIAFLVADDTSERKAARDWQNYCLRQVLLEVSGAPF